MKLVWRIRENEIVSIKHVVRGWKETAATASADDFCSKTHSFLAFKWRDNSTDGEREGGYGANDGWR